MKYVDEDKKILGMEISWDRIACKNCGCHGEHMWRRFCKGCGVSSYCSTLQTFDDYVSYYNGMVEILKFS